MTKIKCTLIDFIRLLFSQCAFLFQISLVVQIHYILPNGILYLSVLKWNHFIGYIINYEGDELLYYFSKSCFSRLSSTTFLQQALRATSRLVSALTRTLPLLVMQLSGLITHCFLISNSRQISTCMEAHFKQDFSGLLRLTHWSMNRWWAKPGVQLVLLNIFKYISWKILDRGSIMKICLIKTK